MKQSLAPRFERAVVTGGAGFIGSHLVRRLIDEGTAVSVFDDLSSGKMENLPEGCILIKASVCDIGSLKDAVQGADVVFHLAAIPSVTRCQDDLYAAHSLNMGGTVAVIEALRDVSPNAPLVFASSAAVYGVPSRLPLCETDPTSPLGFYGLDKLNSEKALQMAAGAFGLRTVALRLFNVYGVRQDPDSPYSGVISTFGARLSKGEAVTIFGDGEQSRDFIRAEDVAAHFVATARAAAYGSKAKFVAYNACTGVPTTINELYRLMAARLEVPGAPTYSAAKAADIRHSVGSREKLLASVDVAKPADFADGISDYLESIRKIQKEV